MIPLENLESVLESLQKSVQGVLKKSENKKQFKKAILKCLETDDYFFNLFTSVHCSEVYTCKQVPFTTLGTEIMELLYTEHTNLKLYIEKMGYMLEDSIKMVETLKKSSTFKSVSFQVLDNLKNLAYSGIVPSSWDQNYGVCINAYMMKYYTYLVRTNIVLSQPFVSHLYCIQDNTKGVLSGDSTYYDKDIGNYEGELLSLRKTFASELLNTYEYFKKLRQNP